MQLALEILKRTFYAAALLVFVTPDCDCDCDCEWKWNSSIESFVLCLPKRLDVYCDAWLGVPTSSLSSSASHCSGSSMVR